MEHNLYLKKVKRKKQYIILFRFLILAGFLFSWELLSHFNIIDSFFFSSPSKIIRAMFEIDVNGTILTHTSITMFETLISFLLTVVCSILLAIVLWIFSTVSYILEPFLVALNSLPKSALAPLLIVWLGTGYNTIIIAGMSVAIFGSVINLYYSFRNSSEEAEKLIYTLGGSRFDVLRKIILPGSIPVMISNMKVNIGLCLVGVIIGEFLAARRGLGYIIIYSTQIFRLDWLIMGIMILCVIAMCLYFLLQFFEHCMQKKY